MKKIPIGTKSFSRLVEGNYYFVDKTLMIKEFLDRVTDVTLITRPRRFGKINNGYDLISVTSLEDAMKIDEASMKIAIFPATFFSPKSFTDGVIRTTTNTYSIHHFAASWLPFYTRWEIKFWHLLRLPNFRILHFIGQLLKKVHLKK